MSIPTEGIKSLNPHDYFFPEANAIGGGEIRKMPSSGGMTNKRSEYIKSLEEDIRLSDEAERELRKQVEMLEQEVDRQGMIIDALIKAIKVIERG